MAVNGESILVKLWSRLVVPVLGKEAIKMGFLIICFLNLGNNIQSIVRQILFVINSNRNNGTSHKTWTSLCKRIARIFPLLNEKSCVKRLIMYI
jgi:hypothetical protein